MARSLLLLLLSCISLLSASAAVGGLHDLLRAHGLPAGVFPKEVESFSIDPITGLLEVNLTRPCYANYDGLAYFDQVVKGNLSYGELGGVEGLSQEELFLWFPVKGIAVTDPSSGLILFDIGLAHKQLSISLFEVPPDCRPEEGSLRSVVGGEGLGGRRFGFQEQR